MKTLNKSKGFTLIELLVVISIIALLSSVVLASLKGAREKAQITKTVAEMKGLQTAIELYRNQFGKYPNQVDDYFGLNYNDDDNNLIATNLGNSYIGLELFFKTELVDRKFLSKVPHAPNYPRNCIANCGTVGYVLGYTATEFYFDGNSFNNVSDPYSVDYVACGGQRIKNYVIYFIANSKKINLPILNIYEGGVSKNSISQDTSELPYVYCLSM